MLPSKVKLKLAMVANGQTKALQLHYQGEFQIIGYTKASLLLCVWVSAWLQS